MGIDMRIVYRVRGVDFNLYRQTGRLVEIKHGAYSFESVDGGAEATFEIHRVGNLEQEIGARIGDLVSIVKFEGMGIFLVFNHRVKSHKFFPVAVMDLHWALNKKRPGFFSGIVNSWVLVREARDFESTSTFKKALAAVQSLN